MEISFTERELDVITVLWDRGPSTAAEVRVHLAEDLAYNTVLTMLRILEEKGYVRHEAEGRAHRYFPLVSRQEAGESAAGRLVRRMFSGSPSLLLTQLVRQRGLPEDELKRLRAVIDEQLGESDR
jgi:BlaI family transcriptional regulator, penicillinase repressor